MAHIIFIISTKQNPNIEDAIDNGLEKEGGDVVPGSFPLQQR